VGKDAFSEALHKLSQSYVKLLPYTYVILLLASSFVFFLLYISPLMYVPIGAIFLSVGLFHGYSVRESVKKKYYPERILRSERWRLIALWFCVLSFFITMLVLGILSSFGFRIVELPAPYSQILSLLLIWFIFFLMTLMAFSWSSFLTDYQMAKLCFQLTLDSIAGILKDEELSAEDAHRHFKWLKLGFQSCNNMLIEKPYLVVVKDLNQYCQYILSVALVGNRYDLKKISLALQRIIKSFGNKRRDFELQSFLTALLFVLGKTERISESTDIQSEMILIRPSLWERIRAAKSYVGVAIGIAIGIINVVAVIPQLISTIQMLFH
jgi:hypothetical protein